MKASEIRYWLARYCNDDEEVWIDGNTLVLDGCEAVLEIEPQPQEDKEWRVISE